MKYLIIFVVLLIALGIIVQAAEPEPGRVIPDKAIFEHQIFSQVNIARVEYGLSPTIWSDILYNKSQEICQVMAQQGHLAHHMDHTPWNENSYGGPLGYLSYSPDSVSPEGIVQGWLDSPMHRSALLSNSVFHSAVGVSFENGFWVAWSFPRYGEPIGYTPWDAWRE